MGLAEKLSASGAHRITGWKIQNKRRAEAGSLALVFLEGTWMIVLQLPAFPKGQCFGWEGTPGAASVGLAWQGVAGLYFFGYPSLGGDGL